MPFRFVALYEILLELSDQVFPTHLIAALYERDNPGLLSRYIAGIAYECWIEGDLPLWVRAQDADIEQVAWCRGRFIDWPATFWPRLWMPGVAAKARHSSRWRSAS